MNSRLPANDSVKHNTGVPMSITKTMKIMKKKSLRIDTEGGGVEVNSGGTTVSRASGRGRWRCTPREAWSRSTTAA
jgi:hypothetical protein